MERVPYQALHIESVLAGSRDDVFLEQETWSGQIDRAFDDIPVFEDINEAIDYAKQHYELCLSQDFAYLFCMGYAEEHTRELANKGLFSKAVLKAVSIGKYSSKEGTPWIVNEQFSPDLLTEISSEVFSSSNYD
jgi:hypothetical protein